MQIAPKVSTKIDRPQCPFATKAYYPKRARRYFSPPSFYKQKNRHQPRLKRVGIGSNPRCAEIILVILDGDQTPKELGSVAAGQFHAASFVRAEREGSGILRSVAGGFVGIYAQEGGFLVCCFVIGGIATRENGECNRSQSRKNQITKFHGNGIYKTKTAMQAFFTS